MTIHDGRMTDFTAGHITSMEGQALIEALQATLPAFCPQAEFHAGVSYRNAMIYRGRPGEVPFAADTVTVPPHDVPDQPAADHRPTGTGSALLRNLMTAADNILGNHPVNRARIAAGKPPASAIWLWGQGKAPILPQFEDLHHLRGAIISAVDLVRGVGLLAGWDRVDVPGATGYLDTDYAAKGRYAVEALKTHDIVCVHVEAPDEASHEGRVEAKVEALARIDRDIVGPVHRALQEHGDFRILISPDHATLIRTRAHDRDWVCWAMSGSGLRRSNRSFDEVSAREAGGPVFDSGFRLMDTFLGKTE